MLRGGKATLLRRKDLSKGGAKEGPRPLHGGARRRAATRRARSDAVVAAHDAAHDADADADAGAPPTSTSSNSTARRSILLAAAATAAAAAATAAGPAPPPAARAALLVLDDDAAAERAYAAARRAAVGLAVERRPGELVALGSGTVWAALPVEQQEEEEEKQRSSKYKDLYVVATYRQVAGAARSDAREGGGLPSLRVFVDSGDDSSSSSSSDSSSSSSSSDEEEQQAGDGVGPYAAAVLGLDPTRDLAVLRARVPASCPAAPLPVAADLPKRGQAVFLVGRGGGGGGGGGATAAAAATAQLSSGVVSALGRSAPAPSGARLYGALQTDLKVGLLSVGGPVVDSAGRLVGVALCPTFSAGGGGSQGQPSVQPSASAGISFALPARTVLLESVPNLAAYGNAAGRV